MKNFSYFLITFCITSSCAYASLTGSCSPSGSTGCTWSIEDGVLTITGSNDKSNPATMKDYGFSQTNQYFGSAPWNSYRDQITSLRFEGYISNIGNQAFTNMTKLTGDVVLPDGLTTVSRNAFIYTPNVNFVIPDTLTSVGTTAFCGYVHCPNMTIYCENNHSNCRQLISDAYSNCSNCDGNMFSYETYTKGQTWYRKNNSPKRIYTVKEATEAVSGNGNNTFSIRYR